MREKYKTLNFMPHPDYAMSHGQGSRKQHLLHQAAPPQWRFMLGSKPVPEQYVASKKTSMMYLQEALGIASVRDGTSTGNLSYGYDKFIGGLNLERAVGGLRNQGAGPQQRGGVAAERGVAEEVEKW